MSAIHSSRFCVAAVLTVLLCGTAFGQSVVGQNTNAVGPTPEGFYRGIPHYQDNEPHCDRNPLLPSNIICMGNGYGGADDAIGDAWPRIYESQDNARTWLSRYATGSAADGPSTSLGLGFGADPIMVCWPGGCGGFFIASNRAEGGGTGGGVFMQLMPELNIESGFRHFSEPGPRTVQLTSGGTFLDKIDAIFLIDTQNPGVITVNTTVDRGGFTEPVTREWPKGRLIVVYAAINASEQNIRIYSTYSDNFGLNWSPPKQVANTTGLDTGVAVAAIDDTVLYAYRQFQDDSGDQLDAVFAAVSTTRGQTIRKPFAVVEDLCAFDQPTVAIPASDDPDIDFDTVASRTNNFVDVSSDGSNFVMVLAEKKRDPNGGCSTQPFDYAAGSRVLVTTAGSNGRGWKTPEPIAPRDEDDPGYPFPGDGHSFQFMPAVDCVLGVCQAIWYDSINDSIRNLRYLTENPDSSKNDPGAATAFTNFPLFGDFFYPGLAGILQFRRTADVFTRQFEVNNGNITFRDLAPVQVSKYQLAAARDEFGEVLPSTVFEAEQNPFSLKQYKGNTVSFMGDYIGLASKKLRSRTNPDDPTGPPIYEPNNGPDPDPLNTALKPSWFAYWTDTRKARGQLYTELVDQAVPFLKTDADTGGNFTSLEETPPDTEGDAEVISGERKLSAEGVEDSNAVGFCDPSTGEGQTVPGQDRDVSLYPNRIKDADVYGALIKVPATAWVLNASKGLGLQGTDDLGNPLGDLQRTYVIAARNEDTENGKKFRFKIANQPIEVETNDARASWVQFDELKEIVDEDAGPQSSVTVALFVVSALPVNPVRVDVYEVDEFGGELLVETLTVNGTLEAGNLVTPDGIFDNINDREIHNPLVYAPENFDPELLTPEVWNPEVWNPEVWNPEVWNPEVWNPEVWNPEVWNPEVWNPEVWNPEVWNPEVWNVSLTDADTLDNAEIPSPNLEGEDESGQPLFPPNTDGDVIVAKFDVQFSAMNDGNTITPYTADFAANTPLVREALANGTVRTQIIVWQDVDLDSYQGCDIDLVATIAGDNSPGENRILAVANDANLLGLEIPSIAFNRKGSVTYYSAPRETVQITIRFVGLEATIRAIAPELITPDSISFVVTSQAANTGDMDLEDEEQEIKDLVPPTLSVNVPLPIVLAAVKEAGEIGAVLPADLVTASKEGEPDPTVTCEDESANSVALGVFVPLSLGQTNLTCSATSAQNNATGSINVAVSIEDNVNPDIVITPPAQPFERDSLNGAIVTYGVTATDNIDDVADIAISCTIPSGETAPFDPLDAPAGTTTEISCTATDRSQNSVSASFSVTVRDTTPPAITPIADVTVGADSSSGKVVAIVAPTVMEIGDLLAQDCTAFLPPVSVIGNTPFPIDETLVTCTATDDAGLTATETFLVTVVDTEPPIIKDGIDQSFEANRVGGVILDANEIIFPTATDFGDPIDVSCDNDPDGFYPLDPTPTTVTCTTVPDTGGLTASTSFTVTIVDTTPPDLTVPDDITTTAGSAVTFVATAEDIADANPVVECSPPSGSAFSFGTTTVTCTATDASGNSDSDTFTVTANLGIGPGLDSSKNSVKAGSVAGFTWIWLDGSGNPVDVGEGNQDIEARLITPPKKTCADPQGDDVLNEDPGSSYIRRSGDGWQFNWQTKDDDGGPIAQGFYCVSAILLTTSEPPMELQRQTTEMRVRP